MEERGKRGEAVSQRRGKRKWRYDEVRRAKRKECHIGKGKKEIIERKKN